MSDLIVHLAVLDPFTGEGCWVAPRPEGEDCATYEPAQKIRRAPEFDGLISLCAVDERTMLQLLDSLGIEIAEDDDGFPLVDGFTDSGRLIFGLRSTSPIYTDAPVDAVAHASAEVAQLVGAL